MIPSTDEAAREREEGAAEMEVSIIGLAILALVASAFLCL